jgi:hypothetical protein
MLFGATVLGMLKAAVIKVIDVAFVLHGEMATSGAMNVQRGLAGTVMFGCHGESFHAHPSIITQDIPKRVAAERGRLDAAVRTVGG